MPRPQSSAGSAPLAVGRFQAAVATCAALAAAFPILALLSRSQQDAGLPLAFLGSVLAVAMLIRLLRPLARVAAGLQDCLSDTPSAVSPAADPAAAGGMAGDVARLALRLDGMRQRLTNRHPVTGLPTREPFLADILADLPDAEGHVVLGVVRFADYDRLAAFDQAAADRALSAFADRLRGALAKSRRLAQVDRDCFAAWFKDAPDRDAAARELQALAYVLGQEFTAGDLTLAPDVAIGAAVFPDDGATPAELLTRAVAALETARQADKPMAFFSAQGSAEAQERFSLAQDLRGAVSRDELLLHFQPLVDVREGRAVGAEALLRWRHPTLGLLGPNQFMPILEQSPVMAEVGLWVLNAACRELRSWRDQGLGDLRIAVNLSPTQCRDPRLNGMVMRTLERHGLPASAVELELTETVAMEDADHTRRLLSDLRAQGVSVAIDDFGAGYSSLSYLKNLPFSKLKIDREFVTGVDQRSDSRAICAALIALSRGLGISLVAEGVETAEEVATLRAMGCEMFQGYFFARPMEGAAFVRKVRDPAWLTPDAFDRDGRTQRRMAL